MDDQNLRKTPPPARHFPSLIRNARACARKRLDDLAMRLAWRLPRRLVYWATIRLLAHATTGEYSSQIVPELRAIDALQRWETFSR